MSRTNSDGSSITDLIGVMPVVSLNGGTVPVWPFKELGAETFNAGEMVSLSGSAGNAVGVTGSPTGASGYGILGFAADDAAGAASGTVGVYVATPDTVFVANIGHSSTSASAQTAATDVGQRYGLTSLSGRTYVDKVSTACSNTLVRVIGLHEQDDAPCFYGRVYFTVFDHACQMRNGWWTSASTPQGMVL